MTQFTDDIVRQLNEFYERNLQTYSRLFPGQYVFITVRDAKICYEVCTEQEILKKSTDFEKTHVNPVYVAKKVPGKLERAVQGEPVGSRK